MAKTDKKIDPFKTKKTKVDQKAIDDTVTPPSNIAKTIDEFRDAQDQARHFEGEATIHKDTILEFARTTYVDRLLNGQDKSYKLLGNETMVTFVVMDSSAGLAEEDLQTFADKWGEQASEDLIERDYRSIRFDPKILEANYDEIVSALQVLPENVLENLFKPMLLKAKPGAVDQAKKYAKSPDDLREIISDLKMKNYIK